MEKREMTDVRLHWINKERAEQALPAVTPSENVRIVAHPNPEAYKEPKRTL